MALMLPRATGKVWLCEEKADPEYAARNPLHALYG